MKTSHLGTLRALRISATESAHGVSLLGILMPPDHSQSLFLCSITIRLPIFLPVWRAGRIQQRPGLQRENVTSAHCGAFPGDAAQRRRGNHAVSTASSQPHGSREAELLTMLNALQHDFVYGDHSDFDKIIAGGQEEIAALLSA